MENLKKVLTEEISGVFEQVTKEKHEGASAEIADILIEEGFAQYKLNELYKRDGIDQEVTIMRLNKYIGLIYNDNSEQITNIINREKEEKIPDNPMSQWFAEMIEEDLYNGRAPFKNDKKTIKQLLELLVDYDPFFDTLQYELLGFYKYVEDNNLIEPVSFVERAIVEDKPAIEETVEETIDIAPNVEEPIGDSIVDTADYNTGSDEPEEEYISFGFNIVD